MAKKRPKAWIKRICGVDVLFTRYPPKDAAPLVFPPLGATGEIKEKKGSTDPLKE